MNAAIIRKDDYSYLVDSKTVLFVTTPRPVQNRGLMVFFIGLPAAAAAGIIIAGSNIAWVPALLFVSAYSAYHLVKSFASKSIHRSSVLYVGAGESPIELFRSSDPEEFAAKRLELEQALMTKPSQ